MIGPDGPPVGPSRIATTSAHNNGQDAGQSDDISDMVEQPAKVMRVAMMIKQLLEEVRAAPLDEASRARLPEIHQNSITELEQGLAHDLRNELDRLTLPLTEQPSDAELAIAQAQLVGWLEGLFHGIQTAVYAQQMTARHQLEQIRRGSSPVPIPQEPTTPVGNTSDACALGFPHWPLCAPP